MSSLDCCFRKTRGLEVFILMCLTYIYVKCVLDIFIIGLIKSTGKGRIPSSLVQERLINLFLDVESNEMSRFLKYFKIRYIRKNQGGSYVKVALKIAKNSLNFDYRGTPWQNEK